MNPKIGKIHTKSQLQLKSLNHFWNSLSFPDYLEAAFQDISHHPHPLVFTPHMSLLQMEVMTSPPRLVVVSVLPKPSPLPLSCPGYNRKATRQGNRASANSKEALRAPSNSLLGEPGKGFSRPGSRLGPSCSRIPRLFHLWEATKCGSSWRHSMGN